MNNISGAMGKGAPPAPDYRGAAEATARGNQVNQISPWATSMWTDAARGGGINAQGSPDSLMHTATGGMAGGVPGAGHNTQTIGLSGPLGDANNSMMSQAASAWANPLDNGAQARQHAEDAIYQRAASRLDPMWNERQRAMGADLINQGVDPNSEAYAKASGNFGRSRNDAYSSALMDAITGGGQEASRQQQMDLMSRLAPLQGMSSLKSLSGMPSTPGGPNYLAAALAQGQYGMDAQKMSNQNMSDLLNGGMALAGAMSDERVKEDITRHAEEILPGVPVATFRYKWEAPGTVHVGVIAQDVEKHYPELVIYHGGYRYVPAWMMVS